MEEVPCRTSLVPLAFPRFVLCLLKVEREGLLDYQGRAGIISIVRWNLRPVIFGVESSRMLFSSRFLSQLSGKAEAHKHKQIFPVTARVGVGGLPTGWGGSKVYVLCTEPKEYNHLGSDTRPGGSVTGVTEKLFMCQMFMCLFRPLNWACDNWGVYQFPIEGNTEEIVAAAVSSHISTSSEHELLVVPIRKQYVPVKRNDTIIAYRTAD